MRDEHVKDAAQDAAEDLTQDVAEDVLGAAEDGLLSVSDGTRQLSGIWLGLWASASGGAAQSASMFMDVPRTCQGSPPARSGSWHMLRRRGGGACLPRVAGAGRERDEADDSERKDARSAVFAF